MKKANDKNIHTISFWACYNDFYKHPLNHVACCWPEVYDKINFIKQKITIESLLPNKKQITKGLFL